MSDLMTDDTTSDLVFSNGDVVISKGVDAVKQAVRQELNTIRGEWFLDLDYGVPYYKDVLIKNPNPRIVEGIFQEKILSVPGVLELQEFAIDYDAKARTLSVKFRVRAYDGVIDFSEVLGDTNG